MSAPSTPDTGRSRRHARYALLLVALVSIGFSIQLPQLRPDFAFEAFLPNDDPEKDRSEAFRARFGQGHEFLLVGIPHDSGVFRTGFLRQVEALTEALTDLPDVVSVLSPTRMEEVLAGAWGVARVPYLRMEDSLIAVDRQRLLADPVIAPSFIAADEKAVLLIVNTEAGLSKARSDSLLLRAERTIAASGLSEVQLGGRIHAQYHYLRLMTRELFLFLGCASLLLAVFLWVAFRSLWGVVLPLGTVLLGILWQLGAMAWTDRPIGILTMLTPTILFVVGMSDVVHILESYLDELRAGIPRAEAIRRTYRHVGPPTFLTAITAAIGFATLGTASVPPLQEFGWLTGIGVLLTCLVAFTLLPALMFLVPPARLLPRSNAAPPLDRPLLGLLQWSLRHRRKVLAGFAVFTLIGIWGTSRIRIDNHLLDDLPAQSPEMASYHFFDRHFNGIRPYAMEVTVLDSSLHAWSPEVLRAMEEVQDELERRYGMRAMVSPVTVVRSAYRATAGAQKEEFRLPEERAALASSTRAVRMHGGEALNALVTPDGRHARMSGRMVDPGGEAGLRHHAELRAWLDARPDAQRIAFHETGMAHLMDRANAGLSRDLFWGLGSAVVLTALLMTFVFRDPRMVVLALLPNLVPLAFVAGVMGFFGIDLRISTAIIFSIAFGIAEDDTIHMLARLRLEMRSGKSALYALKRTYLSTGRAVTVTAFMLFAGFAPLMLSDLGSVFHLGLLATATLTFASVTELILLPALIAVLPPAPLRERDG